jgi:predicted transcriptional regulator of viral defense system
MKSNPARRTLALVRKMGLLRPRDLDQHGIARQYLRMLEREGVIRRIDRGVYTTTEAKVSASNSLAEAAKRVPTGVICLLSALRLHGLTTQTPHEVWMAIDTNAWKPRVAYPPLRIVRFSGMALKEGIQTQEIEGVRVRVYGPAKTVADCFKYRNKIGLDVAIEALRDGIKTRKASMDQLWHAAKVCRVTNVMRPYLEAMA